jgi:hypothetical protein
VLFADEGAVGISRVEAADAAVAHTLVKELYPGGRAHVVDGAWLPRRTVFGCLVIGCGQQVCGSSVLRYWRRSLL